MSSLTHCLHLHTTISRHHPPPPSSPSIALPASPPPLPLHLRRCSSLQVIRAQHHERHSIRFSNAAAEKLPDQAPFLQQLPLKPVLSVVVTCLVSAGILSGHALAVESIRASSLGLRCATFLRGSGWPDAAIVFVMAMLPILELRGAIPVGYWMQLTPLKLTVLAILGNMVPVPLILLFLEKLAKFLAEKSPSSRQLLDKLFDATRKKAGPIQEFEWLGLMLFVAVPFPGTGAWTGAMAASVLGMPFWDAMSANFVGVVFAGLLVNLLVNLGLKYAVIVGGVLFLISTFMWSFLRFIMKRKH